MAPPSTREALENMTLTDADALDCGICCLPLRPPIFQCAVGHALCSDCRGKLASARTCYVCRAPMPDGYRRNHDMERLMVSVRAPCPNAPYGCAAISVVCVYPRGHEIFYAVELKLIRFGGYYLKSSFEVECTNLSSGLPDRNQLFQFLVPNRVKLGVYEKKTIQIQARIYKDTNVWRC